MTRIEKNSIKRKRKTFLILAISGLAEIVLSGITLFSFNLSGTIQAILVSSMIVFVFVSLAFNMIADYNRSLLENYRRELNDKRDNVILKLIVNLINTNFIDNNKKIKDYYNLIHSNTYRTFAKGYYMANARLSLDSNMVKVSEEFLEEYIYKL